MGVEGGSGRREHIQTVLRGFPEVYSRVMHVHADWTSSQTAFQYCSDKSSFRRGLNCRPESNKRSWPGENRRLENREWRRRGRTEHRVADDDIEIELSEGLAVDERGDGWDVRRRVVGLERIEDRGCGSRRELFKGADAEKGAGGRARI